MKRRALAVAALVVAVAVPAQAGAAAAASGEASAITPRLWSNVSLVFTNDANRTVLVNVTNANGQRKGQAVQVFPGEALDVVGGSGPWQIELTVSWCPDRIDLNCAERLTAVVKLQNAAFGYPGVRIDKQDHSFKALEGYTFEKAYGHAAKRGVAKFKTLRKVDTDLKRFRMNFSYVAPPAG
jgi:hypothetical protein